MRTFRQLKEGIANNKLLLTHTSANIKMPSDKLSHRKHIQIHELRDMLKKGEIVMTGKRKTDLIRKTDELVENDMGELEISVEFNRSVISTIRNDHESDSDTVFHLD